MKRIAVLLFLLTVLVAAGCSSKITPQATAMPIATATVATTPTVVPSPTAIAPTKAASAGTPVAGGDFVLAAKQKSGLAGVSAGLTTTGDLYRGDPSAPVTITEYSDFQCPFCSRVFPTEEKLYDQYVKSGQVKFIFRNFPLDNIHPQAHSAANAALCAGVQGQFWPMHDKLFHSQADWSGKADAEKTFAGYAQALGLDVEQFNRCIAAAPFTARIQAEQKRGAEAGVRGTPAFFVNDWFISGAQTYDTFNQRVQDALAGKKPQPTPTLTYAQTHPFEPDPEHPHYTYFGAPYTGNAKAPLLLMEFTDYQCEYCRKFDQEVMPAIEKKYVESGKLMVVFNHVIEYKKSLISAQAAECAGKQGQFFAMSHLLFKEEPNWAKGDEKQLFSSYAKTLNLDVSAFDHCVENGTTANKVKIDQQVAQRVGIRGTPSFLLIKGNRVIQRIPGYLPISQWDKIFAQALGGN